MIEPAKILQPFQFFAEIEGLSTRVDGSVKVILGTQTLNAEAVGKLFDARNKYAYVMMAPEEVRAEDIDVPDSEPEFKGDKTPSQRLRGVLWLMWDNEGRNGTFALYYASKMEQLIEHFKEKLPDVREAH